MSGLDPPAVRGDGATWPVTPAETWSDERGSRAVRCPPPQKQQYSVTADGQRFLLNMLTEESVTSPITLVLNWKPPRAR